MNLPDLGWSNHWEETCIQARTKKLQDLYVLPFRLRIIRMHTDHYSHWRIHLPLKKGKEFCALFNLNVMCKILLLFLRSPPERTDRYGRGVAPTGRRGGFEISRNNNLIILAKSYLRQTSQWEKDAIKISKNRSILIREVQLKKISIGNWYILKFHLRFKTEIILAIEINSLNLVLIWGFFR